MSRRSVKQNEQFFFIFSRLCFIILSSRATAGPFPWFSLPVRARVLKLIVSLGKLKATRILLLVSKMDGLVVQITGW